MTNLIKKFLSNDLLFKYIFGTLENKHFTEKLLETIFNIPACSLSDLKIINSVAITPSNIKNRKFEMDIYVKIPSLNLNVIIEMQDYLNMNTFTKSYLYLSGNVLKLFKSGQKDLTKHPNVMLIIFVNSFSNDLKDFDDTYIQTGKEKCKTIFDDLSNIKIIDLAKYDVKCYNNYIEKPIFSLIRVKKDDEMKKLLEYTKDNELIKEMKEKMDEFQSNEYVQELWLEELLRNSENERKIKEGIEQGIEKGIEKGIEQGIKYNVPISMDI